MVSSSAPVSHQTLAANADLRQIGGNTLEQKCKPGRFSTQFPVLAQRLLPDQWPEADRRAWDQAREPARGMNPGGAAASLRVTTQSLHVDAWGSYLRWLIDGGLLAKSELPHDRLTPQRLGDYLVERRKSRSARTVRAQTIQLSYMIAALAPDRDWSWVRRHPAIPTEREAIDGSKTKEFCDSREMVSNALHYCRNAESRPDALTASVQYRDGLLLALAFSSALRRKNLCQLHLGSSVIIENTYVRIVFNRKDLKNERIVDTLLADFICPYLRNYVSKYRPVLLQGSVDEGSLWINKNGKPLSYHALYGLFRSRTMFMIGRSLHPHSSRYSLASGVIQDDARNIDLAADCLAHKGQSTVQRFYNQAGPASASAVWLKTLEQKAR